MKLDRFFAQYPVFTYQEFLGYLQSTGGNNVKSIWQLLNYHENAGNILRIRRGFYAAVPKGTNQSAHQVSPYLIAGRVADDSILCYHTALDLLGYSHSVFYQFYFLTHKSIRPFTFQNSDFRAMKISKFLLAKKSENFSTVSVNREGLNIRVTSLERTLVDLLDRPEYAGGWEEIWSSFATVPLLNLDQVIQYVVLLDNATTIAKVGFFLETHREQFKVEEQHLRQLEKHKPLEVHYLERSKRKTGKLAKRWNLVIPETVIHQRWEEPHEIL